MDRRSLGRKLEGLEPVQTKSTAGGKRTERLWRLADVIGHLADPGGDGALDLAQERAKLARLQQEKLKLEIAETRGEVARVPVIEQHWQQMVLSMRARLLASPTRAASRVGPEHQAKMLEIWRTEVYAALNDIADDALPSDVRARVDGSPQIDDAEQEDPPEMSRVPVAT